MTEIIFGDDGTARCIYSDETASIMRALGPVRTSRASHVEPDVTGRWWADLRPCGGPVLGPFETRALALAAEVEWLSGHGVPLPTALSGSICACGTGLEHSECCRKGHPR